MPEMIALRVEEGPSAITPLDLEDTAQAFRALGTLIGGSAGVGVNQVQLYDSGELGHLEVWIWRWSVVTDFLQSHTPDSIVDGIEDTGEHEFCRKAEGIEFIQNLKNSIEQWEPFVENDELNLVVNL